MHYLTDKHYTLSSLGKKKKIRRIHCTSQHFQICDIIYSSEYLHELMKSGVLIPNGNSTHIYDVIYHEILLVLRRQAVLPRLCFINFSHIFTFSVIQLGISGHRLHQYFHCEFSKSWPTKMDLP